MEDNFFNEVGYIVLFWSSNIDSPVMCEALLGWPAPYTGPVAQFNLHLYICHLKINLTQL